ncbi:MAG: cytochrome c(L), periplasmic [Methylococcales bacterium]|nr:cytochrome c(L), periplasmic [Methylococcales bacterium]
MNIKVLAVAAGIVSMSSVSVQADVDFRHAIEGTVLDFSFAKKGGNTPGFKKFLVDGKNPYNGDKDAIQEGHDLYMPACSGCHGHEAEGKLGPGLADDYWTYPAAETDKGLFEILYGGAKGMMGPQNVNLNTDEMLHIMAWMRDIYKGDPKKAKWLK